MERRYTVGTWAYKRTSVSINSKIKNKSYVEHKNEPERLRSGEIKGFKTIWEMYAEGVKKYGEREMLGTRNKIDEEGKRVYQWKTWNQVYEFVNKFARGK